MFRFCNSLKCQISRVTSRTCSAVDTQNLSCLDKFLLPTGCAQPQTRALHEFPNEETLRWGIAPVSQMADDFAKALKILPQNHHQIVACTTLYDLQGLEFADKYDVENVYTSFEDLARCPDVDVVYISPTHPQNCELCHLMLDHDKHILCEKPFCTKEAKVLKLLQKARERNLFLMEGMWSRCVPAYHYLRQYIVQNMLGEVYNVQCTLGLPQSRSKLATFGGVTTDFGVYPLQLAMWVYRDVPKNIKASGLINDDGIDVAADIEVSFSRRRTANIHISSEERLPNEAVIRGTKGRIKMTDYWCPTCMLVSQNNELLFPLPTSGQRTKYHNRIGMCYEAEEVRNCVLKGCAESELFNHNESILLANLIDTIHTMLGVGKTYSQVKSEDCARLLGAVN